MANMSYCRFENTTEDLLDCLENMSDSCSSSEHEFRLQIVDDIANFVGQFESLSDMQDWAARLPVDD